MGFGIELFLMIFYLILYLLNVVAEMELKGELKCEEYESFEEMIGASNVASGADKDVIFKVPEVKFGSDLCRIVHPGDGNDDGKTDLHCEKMEGKNKSPSAQFAINIDELVNNVAGSFDGKISSLSRASSNGLGCSSENLSNIMELQTPDCSKTSFPLILIADHHSFCFDIYFSLTNCFMYTGESAMSPSRADGEEDQDSLSLEKMQIEPALPIYLKVLK